MNLRQTIAMENYFLELKIKYGVVKRYPNHQGLQWKPVSALTLNKTTETQSALIHAAFDKNHQWYAYKFKDVAGVSQHEINAFHNRLYLAVLLHFISTLLLKQDTAIVALLSISHVLLLNKTITYYKIQNLRVCEWILLCFEHYFINACRNNYIYRITASKDTCTMRSIKWQV